MAVEIPAEYQQFVQTVIGRGRFHTEGEVVSAALQLLQLREQRLESLRQDVRVGLEELERGEFTDYDDESLKEFLNRMKVEERGRHLQR